MPHSSPKRPNPFDFRAATRAFMAEYEVVFYNLAAHDAGVPEKPYPPT